MGSLHPTLELHLLAWREAREAALAAGGKVPDEIAARRVGVFVDFAGDLEPLRAAGLAIGTAGRALVTGDIALAQVKALAAVPGVIRVTAGQPVRRELDGSVPETKANALWTAATPYKGAGVIVGIIDSGIDVFHESFRSADRAHTRILRIWDQRLVADFGESPPAGYAYGVEFLPADIEAALAIDIAQPGQATFRHIDDPEDGKESREAHGTHVAGIAAGNGLGDDRCSGPGTYVGVAPEADIVVVRYSGGDNRVADALAYIFSIADAKNKPCVVNMSFGWNLHDHNGNAPLERAIDEQLADAAGNLKEGRVVVKSAGNEAAKHRHARKSLTANGTADFTFVIGPDGISSRDTATDTIHVYYDHIATVDLALTHLPTGDTFSHAHGAASAQHAIAGIQARVVSEGDPGTFGKKLIVIQLPGSTAKPVPKGRWKITLTETGGYAAVADLWVDREDDDVYPRFLTIDTDPNNTISIPGTSARVITVGAYDFESGAEGARCSLAHFSSRGLPLADLPSPDELRPHIAAPGVNIKSANSGVSRDAPCCPWCCDIEHVDMDGTSMAAPHVTGVVALMLQKNRHLTCEQVRAHLQVTAEHTDIPPSEVPPPRPDNVGLGTPGQPGFVPIHQNHLWGSGRLNALAAVNTVPPAALLTPAPSPSPAPAPSPAPGPSPFVIDVPAFGPRAALERLRQWQSVMGERPAFQMFAALASTHGDEVRRLVNTNRRVATVWHRNGGPAVLRALYGLAPSADAALPREVAGFPLARLVERLAAILARYASPMLKADLTRWSPFLDALPGAGLDTLDGWLDAAGREGAAP